MIDSKITILFSLVIALLFSGCSATYFKEPIVHVKQIENFHKVDKKLYRSAQPSKEAFIVLQKYGIKNDLDLRQWHDDKSLLKGLNIRHIPLPLNASKVTYQDLVKAVAIIEKTKGKTLVHCLHGSDRTGVVVAAYRIYHGMDKRKAIQEFVHGGYGYHAFWFKNLQELLNAIDSQQFIKDVNIYKRKIK